jgi:glycerol-3-phosphate acyltransferase PlsY
MNAVLVITLGYLLGSIPFAFLLSRRRGVDLRQVGSGNPGATNALRTSGVRTAVLAMLLDGAKGTLAVMAAQLLSSGVVAPVAAALASVVGHVYPIWLRFRGGKGVATAAGAFAVLTPGALSIAAAVFLVVVVATRFISVGSLAGAVTLAVMAAAGDRVVAAGAAAAACLIVYRHRENLVRLVAGTERRIGQRVASPTPR